MEALDLSNSVKALLDNKHHQKIINDFSEREYRIKFANQKASLDGTYHYYSGFEIISETQIKVKYNYGYGDMEYTGNFIVNI